MTTIPTHQEAVKLLRDALKKAEYAIKGREHTGFITEALAATSQVEAATSEAVAWLLEDQGCRAPDDCEEFERVVLAKDIAPDELARFRKAGRAHALALAAPLALPATEQDDEAAADAYTIERMGNMLARIAIAVKGAELPLHRHGYQDLPELVEKAMIELAIYRSAAPAAQAKPDLSGLVAAAHALMDVAMDEAQGRVHVCDRDNRDIKARTMSKEMQALYAALLAHPVAQAEPPVIWEKKKNELGEFYQRSTDGLILHPYQYKAIFGSVAQAKPDVRDAVLEEAAKACENASTYCAYDPGSSYAEVIRALKAKPEGDAWISVEDRLPPEPGTYLLALSAGRHGFTTDRAVEGQYRQLHSVWTVRDVGVAVSVTGHVTHWRELPTPPAAIKPEGGEACK